MVLRDGVEVVLESSSVEGRGMSASLDEIGSKGGQG